MSRAARRAVFVAFGLLVVLGAGGPASASDATDRIRSFFSDVNRVLANARDDERMPERLGELRAMVFEMVDFPRAAEVALGLEWFGRTRAEREEFTRLFSDLLQTSVFAMVGGRARIDNGLAVNFVGELSDGAGVTVATSVLTRSGAEMAVGYRMARRNGRWMVHDVVVDGVSLVDNYRAQFQKVIQRSSYAGLVGEMRTRLAELARPMETATAARAPVTVPAAAREAAPVSAPAPAAPAVSPAPVVVAAAPPSAVARVEPAPAVSRVSEPASAAAPSAADPPAVETSRAEPLRVVASTAPRAIVPRTPRGAMFWVQIGAFREVDRAMRVVAALRDEAISMLSVPGQPLIRVLIGPFPNRAAATAKLQDLQRRGYEAFIAEVTK